MQQSTLKPLFETGRLWQGHSAPQFPVSCSGFTILNQQLTGGGWPAHMLIEWLTDEPVCAPMTLAMATWRQQRDARSLVLLNPPHWPSAEGLWQQGIQPARVDIIQAQSADAGWCLEQLAKADSVASILAWDTAHFETTALRRLQLACQHGNTQLFLVRSPEVRSRPSPAPVRAYLSAHTKGVSLELFKQPGAPARAAVSIKHASHPLYKTSPAARQVSAHTFDSISLH